MEWLKSLYIGFAIFGLGVILVDLLGTFIHSMTDTDGDADGDGDHDADGDHSDGDGDHDGDHDDSDDSSEHTQTHDGSKLDLASHRPENIFVKIIGYLRVVVYFSFGFGSTGWYALYTGKSAIISLVWSVPVGIIIVIIAKVTKRIRRNELNSQFEKNDLLMEKAEVIVKIEKGQMGKVRILHSRAYVDRFARAKNSSDSFSKGETVRIVEVLDDIVYVDSDVY